MISIFDLLGQVLSFIGLKITTIEVMGISLLGWIVCILIITIVVKFVFDNATKVNIHIRKKNKGEKEDE